MYVDEQDTTVQKPDEDAVRAQTEKTRHALEKITKSKVSGSPCIAVHLQLEEQQGLHYRAR